MRDQDLLTGPTLADFPDDARLWVFAAPSPLATGDRDLVLERVDGFLAQWHAHGHPVVGARDLRLDQFLLIAADERATGVSGCSIDSLFRLFKELEREAEISFLDNSRVCFRDGIGQVRSVTRAEFRELVAADEVGDHTLVFDNTIATVGALRAELWELPMRESWHGRAFGRR